MNDIGEGDIVLCVEEDRIDCVVVEVGQTYEIKEAFDASGFEYTECSLHGESCPKTAITLVGIQVKGFWCAACFIRAGRKGDFDTLLAAKELEDA